MNQRVADRPVKRDSLLPQAAPLARPASDLAQHSCVHGAPAPLRILQRKLSVGASDDPQELEADRIADQVLARPGPGAAAAPRIDRLAAAPAAAMAAPESVERVLAGSGHPLDTGLRHDMEQRFGYDFSGVRLHSGAAAAESAQALGARAYTVGRDIVFGAGAPAPASTQGRHLLAHELTHVVQQTGPTVRRAVVPEDVADEMVNREFELADAFGIGAVTLPKGTKVKILIWKNADSTVTIFPPLDPKGFALVLPPPDVPKTLLRPLRPGASKLAPYSAGVGAQAAAVEKNEADLVGKTGAEQTRLQGLLVTRRKTLNRKLIQETMYNRFDLIIESEVAAANASHGLKGADKLDPDLVKAMIFQETEMGTSGTHLELAPSHPVKTRFNLGQVIDSSGMALFTMLEREQPAIIATFSLGSLRSDLAAAQAEKKTLAAKAKPSAAEATRLAELERLAVGSWETFIWAYKATGKATGFADAVNAFFATSAPAKNVDYTFWIHMMLLWLFEKKTKSRTWLETIKAYNGSGKRAEHYRKAVEQRAAGAEAAAAAGKTFSPTR